jgi:glucokinase
MLSEAAAVNDAVALEVWTEIGTYLGAGAGSMINVFAPDVIAIGGQIAGAWPYLSDALIRQAQDVAVPSLFGDCRIVKAKQTEDAGILGAVVLARRLAK